MSASKEKDYIHYIAVKIDGEVKDEKERENDNARYIIINYYYYYYYYNV